MKNNKISKKELSLYKPIGSWFVKYLQNKNKGVKVEIFNVHNVYLSDFFAKKKFKKEFPDYPIYKIKVDLLGILERAGKYKLIFIEVKNEKLNLSHLAQLLVYSKLVRPTRAVLISPYGLSKHLNDIIKKYRRLDMLEYMPYKKIELSKWDKHRGAIFL